ncbi:MAG: sigma-70 family RNA polymerase sigma factor [Kiritimatiellae bacterium]|nr:sigma-70 family RNA polymerase sigma factor [Kiritimatiellia bacterium]
MMNGKDGYARVMEELVKAQFELFAYVCALTANSQDARDILQETNLKICSRAADYDPLRPFLGWAKTLAIYEVMTHRKKQRRDRLVFDDDVFENLAAQTGNDAQEVERYLGFLEGCIHKLPPALRESVEARYLKRQSVGRVAQQLGRSANAVSLLLMRARQALSDCVRLAAEEAEQL